jgi:polar amino acid transport system permease protein
MDKESLPSASPKEIANIPGAEPSARLDAWWWLVALVVVTVIALVFLQPDPFQRILVFVADGIGVSILVTIVTFIIILALGLVGGLGRLSKNRVIYGFFTLYVEMIRGIPLLVQLIWWYYAFPIVLQKIGLDITKIIPRDFFAVSMAILGLAVCYGAYVSEIYRAGIQSIPKGQMEAARSLGMTYFQSMRFVILPQAVRVILPPLGNEFIALLKDSSLVSAVAVADLTRRGREFMAMSFLPLQTWIMVALLYLIMTLIAARMVGWIEKKTKFER